MPDQENQQEPISENPHLFGSIPKMTLVYSSLSLFAFLILMILMINVVQFPQFVTTQVSLSLGERSLTSNSGLEGKGEKQIAEEQLAFLTNFKMRIQSFQEMIRNEKTDPERFLADELSALESRINDLKTGRKGIDLDNPKSKYDSGKMSLMFQIPNDKAKLITSQIVMDLIQGNQFPYEQGNIQLIRIQQEVQGDVTLINAICQIDSRMLEQWDTFPTTFQTSLPVEELSVADLALRKFTGLFRQDSSF